MMKACRSAFTTKRIHIGMDEAHMMGFGRYRAIHGEAPRFEIFCRHLSRVIELCRSYDFEPMIWSDMFFRILFGNYIDGGDIDKELLKLVPPEVSLVYWDYYQTEQEAYTHNITRHNAFPNTVVFAGGAWRWQGYAPLNRHSILASRLALNACTEGGIKDVFVTAWGDNGNDASFFTVLPVLQLYAETGYADNVTDEALKSRFAACTGENFDDWMLLDLPDCPEGKPLPHSMNPSKYLLFQDILLGLFDCHTEDGFSKNYQSYARQLAKAAENSKRYGYVFHTLEALCTVLTDKCDAGVRIKSAYDTKDIETLNDMAIHILPGIKAGVEKFHRAVEAQWMKESRPQGYEVQDIRLGALEARISTAIRRINDYTDGKIERMEELEETRLRYDCRPEASEKNVGCNLWHRIVTAGMMADI